MAARRPTVVLDTNVWISGLLSPGGAPAQLTRLVLRLARPVFTDATFDELADRIWRPKFDRYVSMEQRKRWLGDLRAVAEAVVVPTEVSALVHSRDASDDKFIHAALAAKALCLVSGDQDLLVLKAPLAVLGLRVLTPNEALQLPELSLPHSSA